MAGIGRAPKNEKTESVEALKKDFNDVTERIRRILNGRKDANEVSREEKNQLRSEYSQAAGIAYKLSRQLTDIDESNKYKDLYKRATDRAALYGSVLKSNIPNTTFDDVKGLDEVKKLVKSFMFMAQNPDVLKYYKMESGLGMLMYGAPGTGKTMFAEAIANAMALPLFIITPADIFKSYVGESEQAVKQIFEEIDSCPDGAVLFVDECESIFSKRTSDTKDYKSAVTTELLQRINGFGVDGSTKRIMIAATNRPDIIDSAYLRYKRFSHLVHIPPPDIVAKRAIINSKLDGIALDGITPEDVLDMTEKLQTRSTDIGVVQIRDAYYSAADICGLIEEACRLALEKLQATNSTAPIPLTREMFEKAFEKIKPSIPASLLKTYENFR